MHVLVLALPGVFFFFVNLLVDCWESQPASLITGCCWLTPPRDGVLLFAALAPSAKPCDGICSPRRNVFRWTINPQGLTAGIFFLNLLRLACFPPIIPSRVRSSLPARETLLVLSVDTPLYGFPLVVVLSRRTGRLPDQSTVVFRSFSPATSLRSRGVFD